MEKIPDLNELTIDEINAILTHKWYLSEKAGYDAGMEYAKDDFFKHHSKKWRIQQIQKDYEKQKEEILKHKYYLSEKRGCEVDIQEAALDWINSGYAEHWRTYTGPYKDRK